MSNIGTDAKHATKPLEKIQPDLQGVVRTTTARKVAYGITALWLIFFPLSSVFVAAFTDNFEPPSWFYLFIFPATFISLALGRWLYNEMFRLAQARWPAARFVRQILSPLLKALLFRHHHHSS
ncbi:hypothetical protein [Bradyrhizobium sp. Tv2a-2]|uniref:hypothetical protein n=1 Tax=Bradyrhizobium sp. Tv2a-2 TaxID=113395 RepID=UPI000467E968|nr:hypothetical protein [Bradyrhizobium sp. Tv2a-2]